MGERASVRASRGWWDGAAAEYAEEHGRFLGDGRPGGALVWGPEGWTEAELGLLGPVSGRRILEVGAGGAQGARWLAGQGAHPVALDLSHGMLRHALRHEPTVPLVQADAAAGWFLESRVSPLVHRGTHAVAVSASTARELVGLGHPDQRLLVVRNGSDTPGPLPRRDDLPRAVVVSRLVPHKQVEHAIEAVASLRDTHPDVRLRIVGEGYHRPELEGLAARLGVAERVDFLGHVSDAERDAELARAWVHVLPSLKEGWGLVAVEAAACGTPTLAYRSAGGVNESVVHGVTGYLCDDQADLVARLDALLSDRALVERMGLDCGIHAAAHSWKSTIDGFEDALLSVHRARRRSARDAG